MTTPDVRAQAQSNRSFAQSLSPAIIAQFLRFGTVGTIGFVIDTAVVYSLRGVLGLYGAGMVSYLVAASANWALNRAWTFRGHHTGPAHRQWMRFMAARSGGLRAQPRHLCGPGHVGAPVCGPAGVRGCGRIRCGNVREFRAIAPGRVYLDRFGTII